MAVRFSIGATKEHETEILKTILYHTKHADVLNAMVYSEVKQHKAKFKLFRQNVLDKNGP